MSKPKNDFASIGNLYGSMLTGLKHQIVAESKVAKIKVGEIGDAPLIKGGPQTTAGYLPAKIDKKTMSQKELDDNLYHIDELSYDEDEETKKPKKGTFTKTEKAAEKAGYGKKAAAKIAGAAKAKAAGTYKEGSEQEITEESRKIVKDSINNFMRKKSIFDKLYENVMQPGGAATSGPVDHDMDDEQELDALGIKDESDDMGGEDEVTLTLDRATAQKLHDVLMSVLGEEEDLGAEDEFGGEDEFGEEDLGGDEDEEGFWDEDEEDIDASDLKKEVNMGKNNKVGNLKVQSGGAQSKYTDKVGNDGDYGHAGVNAKQPNMGKSNKVGSLKTGKSMFEQ